MICDYVHDDGAYVLGALAPAERDAYERHLAGCPACREAVAEIAVLPGLLGRLDAAGLAQITPPPPAESRMPTLLGAVRRERRQQQRAKRWRYAGTGLIAACLALVVGLGAGWLFSGGGAPQPGGETAIRLTAMQQVQGKAPVTAEIGLADTKWGTKVTMHCHYQQATGYAKAYTFRLVAYGPDGATEQVGSWVAGPGEDVTFTGATRFTAAELVRLELIRQDGAPLLAYNVP
jgi:predicted anti-sigma-YlaC factor YlaD